VSGHQPVRARGLVLSDVGTHGIRAATTGSMRQWEVPTDHRELKFWNIDSILEGGPNEHPLVDRTVNRIRSHRFRALWR
jgi:hypothetical protein